MARHFFYPIWVKYGVRDLHIGLMLLCICELHDNQQSEDSDFL